MTSDEDPDPLIFGPPDPDPLLFSSDPVLFSSDPDPSSNNGFVLYLIYLYNIHIFIYLYSHICYPYLINNF